MTSLTGRLLGEYQVLEPLGRGDIEAVYRAYHARQDRYVTLRILDDALARDPVAVERFQREGAALLGLQHPNIVGVQAVAAEAGVVFLVRDYIANQTLQTSLAGQTQGRLSEGRALKIAQSVLSALAYLHSQGRVHGDLRPSKILLAEDGRILLTDYGRVTLANPVLEYGALIAGTPGYMSPEQGQGRPIDARSDVYALGVVLYQTVTGRLPFEGDTPMQIILRQMTALPVPPRQYNPALLEPLERLLFKALQANPDARYQTAAEMGRAVASILASLPPEADSGLADPQPASRTAPSTPVGVGFQAGGDATFGGDVVGRDKVTHVYQTTPAAHSLLLEEAKQTAGVLAEFAGGHNYPAVGKDKVASHIEAAELLTGKLREYPAVVQALRDLLSTVSLIQRFGGRMNFPSLHESDDVAAELERRYQAVVRECNAVLTQR